MKPILLKIVGLNSFLEEQIIDFSKLTTYGFFGIFGTTGSGKSTIIDAITLALYGKISRYDGDKKAMQCINTATDIMSVVFEFQIKTEEGYINYEIERSFKRKENRIEPLIVRFKIKKGTEITILEEKTKKTNEQIKKVLGLSYEDFSRTVVLPQGKFSDFLMLANVDRRNMLERIFKLEKYGDYLTNKIRSNYNQEMNACKIVDNSLGIYGDISEKQIDDNIVKIENEENKFSIIKEKFETTNIVLFDLKQTQKIYNEYKNYNDEKNKLLSFENHIKDKIIILNNSKKANIVLPYIKNLDSTNDKLTEKEATLKNENLKYKDIILKENETTVKYKEIEIFKNENLPILQEKRFKTNEAISFQKDLKQISIDREKLLDEYNEVKNNFKIHDKLKTDLLENKKDLNEQLQKITLRKEEINIEPTFRNNITAGLDLCFKENELIEKNNLLKNKYVLIKDKIDKSLLSLEENRKQLQQIEADLLIFNTQLEDLIKNTPEQKNLLLIKESLINKENELKNNIELNELIKNAELKIKKISDEIEYNKELFNDLNKKILSEEQNFIDLENQIEKIKKDNLIYIITKDLEEGQPCPVCGSLEYKIDTKEQNINIDTYLQNKDKLKDIITRQKDELQKIKINIELKIRDLELSQKQKTEYEIKIVTNTCDLENQIEKLKTEFLTLNNQIQDFNNKKEHLDSSIKVSINLLNDYKVKIAKFSEINISNNGLIKELEDELKLNVEELLETKNKLESLINTMNISSDNKQYFHIWKEKIIDYDKENQLIEKKEKSIRKELDTLDLTINKYANIILECEKEQERITTIGNEKKNLINSYLEKIKNLVGDNEPNEYLQILDKQIDEIIKNEKTTKEKLELILKDKEEVGQFVEGIKKQIDTLQEIKIDQQSSLELKLVELNFALDEVLKCIIGTVKENELENNINNYKESLSKVNNNIETLEKKLIGKNIKNIDTEVLKYQEITELLSKTIETKTKEIAILKENTIKMQNDFLKVEALKQQKDKHTHQIDLLSDLANLFQGNRFVEFIAKKQLKYITIEASNRLKEMTKGRYSLELDETDFVIRDDFNGGIRRSPRTLSGGETFMTSLCLALALSSKVQLNNKNPLEFFFLDEGFGTLDPNALDDVINTLEKLRMENINIGIISHSEELKNRVPIKLTVLKSEQGFGGSRVFIE